MKLTKTLFITFLILAVVTGFAFFFPGIIGAANTGGNSFIKCLLMIITSGGLVGVVIFFYYLVTRKDRLSAAELKKDKEILNARAEKLEKDLGGVGASVSVKVDGVAEDEVDATEPKQAQDPSAINWTVKSRKSAKDDDSTEAIIVDTINQGNKVNLAAVKIIAIAFVSLLAVFAFLGAIIPVVSFEKVGVGGYYEVDSICHVAGYYIEETDYSKTRESSKIYHSTYSYATNKKTNEIVALYTQYLADEGFVYNSSTKSYTLTNSANTYKYSVKLSKKANTLIIKYTSEKL